MACGHVLGVAKRQGILDVAQYRSTSADDLFADDEAVSEDRELVDA